jgi:DNA-binding NarL/FixJ family response regulator
VKIELKLTPEQWWALSTEAEHRGCTVTDVVISASARTNAGQEARRESVEALHARGLSDAAIGQRLGMTNQAVQVVRRRLGLPANSRVRELARQRTNQEESKAS